MLILTKSVLALMISFLISVLFAVIVIPLLRKLHAGQRLSIYLEEAHKKKQGTPTMGGIIFIIPTLFAYLLLFLMGKVTINISILIVLITFIGYAFIGFLDDYLIIKRHNNKGLSESQKLLGQLIIAVLFFYLFSIGGNEKFNGWFRWTRWGTKCDCFSNLWYY